MKGDRKESKFFNNWQIKVLCLIAAVILFFFATYVGQQKRTITLPLTVILPDGLHPTSVIPESANVIIQGSEEQIYILDSTKLSISADFSRVREEGVSSVPVVVDTSAFEGIVDLKDITFYASPSTVRIYFEK